MTKEEIPKALKESSICTYKGSQYAIEGFYMFADKNTKALKYSAVLLDKCGNSTITVPLEMVTIN